MSKGVESIVIAVILVLITVISTTAFYIWNQKIGERLEETARNASETQSQESRSSFFIVNAAGNQVGVKNNGQVSINMDEFSFYMNSTMHDSEIHQSPSSTSLGPSQIAIFNITDPYPYGGNYTVRVTGPYGKSDEIFAEMYSP